MPQSFSNVLSEQVQTKPENSKKPENDVKPESGENAGSGEKKEEPAPQNRPVATEGFLARCGGCLVWFVYLDLSRHPSCFPMDLIV